MACLPPSTKPLIKSMLTFCQLSIYHQSFIINAIVLLQQNAIESGIFLFRPQWVTSVYQIEICNNLWENGGNAFVAWIQCRKTQRIRWFKRYTGPHTARVNRKCPFTVHWYTTIVLCYIKDFIVTMSQWGYIHETAWSTYLYLWPFCKSVN